MTQVSPSTSSMVPQVHRSPSASFCYRFAEFDLVASSTLNSGIVPAIELTGFLEDGSDLVIIQGQIPIDLKTPLEAAAWISFVLRSDRRYLNPLPDWFIEGESNWDLAPPARDWLEAKRTREAYKAGPKCFIDRDYARPLRRNLMEEISRLREGEEADMTFSFDGRVLSVDFRGQVHEVVASGKGWPTSFRVLVSSETQFPARFKHSRVEVSVFDGYVRLDWLRFGSCEAVPNAESP